MVQACAPNYNIRNMNFNLELIFNSAPKNIFFYRFNITKKIKNYFIILSEIF